MILCGHNLFFCGRYASSRNAGTIIKALPVLSLIGWFSFPCCLRFPIFYRGTLPENRPPSFFAENCKTVVLMPCGTYFLWCPSRTFLFFWAVKTSRPPIAQNRLMCYNSDRTESIYDSASVSVAVSVISVPCRKTKTADCLGDMTITCPLYV